MKSYEKSNELVKQSLEVTPLGAQTFSKSYRYFVEGYAPMFMERGEGCKLYDVDGNEFIDFVCSLGPITVGYNNKKVNDAVIEQLNKGIIFSTQAEVEVKLAKKITEIIPCAEMVRFVKNGGDATTSAIRLARAFTGRDRVAMSGYHGMHDWSIGASANNRGVPKVVCELTDNFVYNDIDSLKSVLEKHPNEYAAVILEPIQGNGTTTEYLEEVKKVAHEHGALLIFDEVVSGFRYALGGAQEYYNVTPDMCSFGKGIANGMPISAVAGRKDVLSLIEKGVFVSTTFGGDAISMAGALATIEQLEEPGTYEKIWELGNKMLDGLKELIEKHNVGEVVSCSGLAPHGGVAFEGKGSLSYLDVHTVYSYSMIDSGILTFAINNLNKSHTEKEIDAFLEAADKAFALIRKALDQDSLKGLIPEVKNGVNPVFKRNIK